MKTKICNPNELRNFNKVANLFYKTLAHTSMFFSHKGYNLTISEEKEFIWFRVAKVASRTIYHHLKENTILDVDHAFDVYYSLSKYKTYFKFAFVRNPWDRLISCWFDKVIESNFYKFNNSTLEKMQDLGNFINYIGKLDITICDCHLRLQSELIDLNNIDFLGRFEDFNSYFIIICKELNLPYKNIKHFKKSSRDSNYKRYYTNKTRDQVFEIYKKDIQIFNYTF